MEDWEELQIFYFNNIIFKYKCYGNITFHEHKQIMSLRWSKSLHQMKEKSSNK
jgi:hypothetical protein